MQEGERKLAGGRRLVFVVFGDVMVVVVCKVCKVCVVWCGMGCVWMLAFDGCRLTRCKVKEFESNGRG